MSRLMTLGFEVVAPVSAVLSLENPFTLTVAANAPTRATAHQRTGTGCLSCDSGAGNAASWIEIPGQVASRTRYYRAYLNFRDLPGATIGVLGGSTTGLAAKVTSAGKVQLFNMTTGLQVGSDSAATIEAGTDRYYCFELKVVANASTQVTGGELRLDGATVATASGLTLVNGSWALGWFTAPGASKIVYVEDFALNDDQGSVNNSWCGPGKVVMLTPTSTSAAGSGWALGTGTAEGGNGWDSVNNIPPTGVADLAAGSDPKQIRNAASAANSDFDANLQSYSAAGVGPNDVIAALTPWVATAAPVSTSAKAGQIGIASNPAIALANLGPGGTSGAFWSGVAAGTYPTGWKWSPGTVTEQPSVTKATAPVARVRQVTSSTRIAMVCFLGMYVDYVPTSHVRPHRASVVAADSFASEAGYR